MGLVLVSGVAGFVLALIGYLGLGLPLGAAVLLWVGSGPAGAALALLGAQRHPGSTTPAHGPGAFARTA